MCKSIDDEGVRQRIEKNSLMSVQAPGRLSRADGLNLVVGYSDQPGVTYKCRSRTTMLWLHDLIRGTVYAGGRNVR